jgi:hypothetical protein
MPSPFPAWTLSRRVYERGGYEDRIDYREPPPPPLSEDEAAWVDTLLREQGRGGPSRTDA